MIKYALLTVIAYFIGNFSSAYIYGKMFEKKDIRNFGSQNAGATNMLRVFGAKLGLLTFLTDALKGVLAVYIGTIMAGQTGGYVAGVFVVVGHNWPVLLGFKGGKGIAASVGTLLAINFTVGIIAFSIGILIIVLTRYVSLGSVTSSVILPIIGYFVIKPFDVGFTIFALMLAIMSVYRHRSNIGRLLSGTESKIGSKKQS